MRVKQKDISITSCSYFCSVSDSSSCVIVVREMDTNIASSRPAQYVRATSDGVTVSTPEALSIFVYLQSTTKRGFLRIWMQSAYNTMNILEKKRRPRASRLPSGCTTMRDLDKTLEMGRMSALTVFGDRLVSVTVVVVIEEERVRLGIFFLIAWGDVSGMAMTGSNRLDGEDGGIRVDDSERVRPQVMWSYEYLHKRIVALLSEARECCGRRSRQTGREWLNFSFSLFLCECIIFYFWCRRHGVGRVDHGGMVVLFEIQ